MDCIVYLVIFILLVILELCYFRFADIGKNGVIVYRMGGEG